MKFLINFIKSNLILFGILLLTFIIYLPVTKGFFQQDEWLVLGDFVKNGFSISTIIHFFTLTSGHWTPLTSIGIYSLIDLFWTNYSGYAFASLFLHLVCVVLFFIFSQRILNNQKLSYLATVLFGIGASGMQATSWPIADINTHGATILGLISLILFFDFLKNNKYKYLSLSLLFIFLSLLFKEITFGLFLILPFTLFIFENKKINKMKVLAIIFVFGFLYCSLRLFGFLSGPPAVNSKQGPSQSLHDKMYNFATIPFKSIPQTVISPDAIVDFSYTIGNLLPTKVTGTKGTTEFGHFVERRLLEIILFVFVVAILLIVFTRRSKLAFWSIVFIFINSVVFSFAPERTGIISVLDSRNLYFTSIGGSILLAYLLSKINRKISYLVILLIIAFNISYLSLGFTRLQVDGLVRKQILQQISNNYGNLPSKVVFYTESDKSYYGLAESEKILPFESGFGQTLLVWFSNGNNFPHAFLGNRFLWEIQSQDYQEENSRGFGYFRDFNLLADTILKYHLPLEDIISFRYSSNNNLLEDMSSEIRGRVTSYFSKKKVIVLHKDNLSSDYDLKDLGFLIDKQRNTFWDSKVPYLNPQYVELNLKSTRKVAEIDIDSYNNEDQNAVGYQVLLSSDGKDWKQVYKKERVDHDHDGVAKLYFEPMEAVFIKINQIGYHKYASWAISELTIYEAIN